MNWENTEDAYCQSRHLEFGGDSQSGSAISVKILDLVMSHWKGGKTE